MIRATSLNKKLYSGLGMELTAIIRNGEKQFVALCPEVDVVSQGKTVENALANPKEAVELYIEEIEHTNNLGFNNYKKHSLKT